MREDFILGADGDFPLDDNIIQGVLYDTPYGESDTQHVVDGIFVVQGGIKQFPTYGFGAIRYLNQEYSGQIENNLKQTLDKDGYKCLQGAIYPGKNGTIQIDTRLIIPK